MRACVRFKLLGDYLYCVQNQDEDCCEEGDGSEVHDY